jgi:hypothetical protein
MNRSLGALRLSILAAAGISVVSCVDEMLNPLPLGGTGGATASGSSTASSAGSGGSGGGTSSSGSTGTAGAGGSGGAAGPGDAVCAGAQPLPATDGTPSGFAQCPNGTIHRDQVVACDPVIVAPACTGTEKTITCASDADCTAGLHGKCVSAEVIDDALTTVCGCFYTCANDAECGAGQVCVCGGVVSTGHDWSTCAPAKCTTGADCASGECAVTSYTDNCVIDVELGCRSPADACHVDEDCVSDSGPYRRCVLTSTGDWACKASTCTLGRPLLIQGQPRTAPAVPRADWAADVTPAPADLDERTRAALAHHWLAAAALEHASVASFARFTLELLAVGAPPALVAAAQRAAVDEVEHARIAYGLASAYAGRALGPGPLDLGALQIAVDRGGLMRSLIEEACVGETVGVAEALALAARAADPELARVHRRIADDEQRHAELAWRTLAWLLDEADAATLRLAAGWFDDAVALAAREPEPTEPARPELGLLGARELGAVRRQALREVVTPCAAALLRSPRRARPESGVDQRV